MSSNTSNFRELHGNPGIRPHGLMGTGSLHIQILLFILPIIAWSLGPDDIREYSHILFGTQILLIYLRLARDPTLLFFLTPAMLMIQYVGISFMLGGWAFANGLVLYTDDHEHFLDWDFLHLSTAFVLLGNNLAFFLDLTFHSRYRDILSKARAPLPANFQKFMLPVVAVVFLMLYFFPLRAEFFGGAGDLSIIPKTISALFLFYVAAYYRKWYRAVLYGLTLIIFSAFSYSSKREAVFLLFPILLIESILNIRALRLWMLIPGALLAFAVSALIIVMSLMRGYGEFMEASEGFLAAIPLILPYIQSDLFLAQFFLNIESNYTYYHTMQAMEYVFSDANLITYGSTIIKFLFIAIPSSVVGFKPNSMTHIYTLYHDPAMRAIGGSWPPNIYAEMFWNFHLVGLIMLPAFLYLATRLFLVLCSWVRGGQVLWHTWALYAYMQFLFLARGSGLDLYIVYIIFAVIFSLIYIAIYSILTAGSRMAASQRNF